MKKVLIISYNFAPRHTVGAIRPSKIAHNLVKMGYTVDVVCVKPFGRIDHSMDSCLEGINRFYYIDKCIIPLKTRVLQDERIEVKGMHGSVKNEVKTNKGRLHEIKAGLSEMRKLYRSGQFVKKFKKVIRENRENFAEYDIVFSTFGPNVSHMCALAIKKEFPGVKWIADFRDPMVVYNTSVFTRRYFYSLQDKICRKADELVAVSVGYYERIFGEKYKHKAHVIYNGYDRNDYNPDNVKRDGKYSFVCIGSLYGGKRDTSPLFRALRELVDEGRMDVNDITFKYAGIHSDILAYQADKYGLAGCIEDYGTIPRDKCIELQGSARNLVLVTWNGKKDSGMIPLKFYEYIMMQRPIICIVSGKTTGHECREMIERGDFGITYEEGKGEADHEALKKYLYEDYLKFKNGEENDFCPVKEEAEKYDYALLTKQIEELF